MDTVKLFMARLASSDPSNPVPPIIGSDDPPIFGGFLPEEYDPQATGVPAIVVTDGGGTGHDEIPDLVTDRLQVRIWAGRGKFDAAKDLYDAVRAWMHGAERFKPAVDTDNIGTMLCCLETVRGQSVLDSDTKWATIVSFWEVKARA